MLKTYFIFILFFLFNNVYAISFDVKTPIVNKGQTVLITYTSKKDIHAKLTVLKTKKNFIFVKNPLKENSYFALIPVSYYTKHGQYKVIISYQENTEKKFKGTYFEVLNGNYKSETIKVSHSKVKPNKKFQSRIKKEYTEAMNVYHTFTNDSLWKSEFTTPLQSKITSDFGTRRVYNNILKSYHSGTDFKAKTGTKIQASNSGIVRISQNRYYAGNTVVIDHGYGIFTCYFHLSTIYVKNNQKVKKDQLIGLSGATGRVTGPHLHFSARVDGIQVDPLQLLKILNQLSKG